MWVEFAPCPFLVTHAVLVPVRMGSLRRTSVPTTATTVADTAAVGFEKVGRVRPLKVVALFVYVTLLLVVDWLTAADKTEVLCLIDNRLVTKVSSLEGFGEVATWTICNCIVFDFHASDFPVFVET